MSTSVKDIENTLAISTGADDVDNFFYINIAEKIDADPAIDISANASIFLDENFQKENSLLLKKVDSSYMIFQLQKSSKNFIYNDNYDFIRYNKVGDEWNTEKINEDSVTVNQPTLDAFSAATVLALPFSVYKTGNPKQQTYTISHEPNSKNITIIITTITT